MYKRNKPASAILFINSAGISLPSVISGVALFISGTKDLAISRNSKVSTLLTSCLKFMIPAELDLSTATHRVSRDNKLVKTERDYQYSKNL